MSNYKTHKDRKILPEPVVLTSAETNQVAGGVSSEPIPTHAYLPSDPCHPLIAAVAAYPSPVPWIGGVAHPEPMPWLTAGALAVAV
jgi:hypothetical protein